MTETALQLLAARRRLPETTYRLQFHAGFTFRDAAAIAPYLRDLGITHVYASPYLKARAGSTHGYDIIDHCKLNPELGTQADFDAFVKALTDNELSQILDTVPNHVGVATNDNTWWNDVLEHGSKSKFGTYFDIAWDRSPRPELRGKVLLPTLGEPYGRVLDLGQLVLSYGRDSGKISVNYFDRRFPINRDSFVAATGLNAKASADQIEAAIQKLNGKPGEPRSFDAIDRLLEAQSYRLTFWRVAADEVNYRRFFDINDLAALAMEHQEVFESTHKLIFELLENGTLTGLRIDHPDGLYDPKQYFDRLQDRFGKVCSPSPSLGTPGEGRGGGSSSQQAPATPSPTLPRRTEGGRKIESPLYVVAEKILAVDEPLPPDWPIHGTSGYDYLNYVNGLFIDPAGQTPLTDFYAQRIHPDESDFQDLVYRKKKLILDIALASELNMLAHQLDRLAQRDRGWRDFTLNGLRQGLWEVIACFGVYRTYITDAGILTGADRKEIESAVKRATERNPKIDASIFNFIRDVLLLQYPQTFDGEAKAAQQRFAGKFQQLTAPVTAKGIEDTAFYIYNRLISLNEVGGDPDHFGVAPAALHHWFADRQANWPYAMSSLSTHDTKRSEDVRARINVLSEIPSDWIAHVSRWLTLNEPHRQKLDGDAVAPSLNDEYLLYQTLLGAWPFEAELTAEARSEFSERIAAYMTKAMREAKVHTSWTSPNEAYEQGVTRFVQRLLVPAESAAFLDDFLPFQRRVSEWGIVNSLSQTLLRIAAPGVPDTYQGTELWDLSLVDPDNRRPVDYKLRQGMLKSIEKDAKVPAQLSDPLTKLLVTSRALRLRRDHPGLFSAGDYLAMESTGPKGENVFSFARRDGDHMAVVAVTRLPAALGSTRSEIADAWKGTSLTMPFAVVGKKLRNVLTDDVFTAGETADVSSLFERLPIALLISEK